MGQYPEKALSVLRNVSSRIEKWWREEKLPDVITSSLPYSISKELCKAAAAMGKLSVSKFYSHIRILNNLYNIKWTLIQMTGKCMRPSGGLLEGS